MKKYNEILDLIRSAYFEKTGENAELYGDIGARFQAVASELLSLYVYGEFVLKQAFPQTAAGQYLDNHAALRDIKRKTAQKAEGQLTFYVLEPAEAPLEIPEGTVCSVKNRPFIQFVTTEQGSIAAGDTQVTVNASATQEGAEANAGAGTVTVMVNPPVSVYGVTNEDAFSGGYDEESDESLRKRILSSYKICQSGFSAESIREQLLAVEEATDCMVLFNDGEYIIYVKTKSGQLTEEVKNALLERLSITRVSSYPVNIINAEQKSYNLVLNVQLESDDEEVVEKVEENVKALCSSVRMGENLSLARAAYAAASVDGVTYCEASSGEALDGYLYSDNGVYLELNTLKVNYNVGSI